MGKLGEDQQTTFIRGQHKLTKTEQEGKNFEIGDEKIKLETRKKSTEFVFKHCFGEEEL